MHNCDISTFCTSIVKLVSWAIQRTNRGQAIGSGSQLPGYCSRATRKVPPL